MKRFGKCGCYVCSSCGKKTRETGQGESEFRLCARCNETGQDENSVSDGCMTEEEYFQKWGEHSVWHKE